MLAIWRKPVTTQAREGIETTNKEDEEMATT